MSQMIRNFKNSAEHNISSVSTMFFHN